MKRVRLLHFYLGLLLAPSILFFALSGAFQLFGLHEAQAGDTAQPPRWIATIAQVHMKQNLEVHEKPLRPARLQSKAPKDNLLLKWYFLFMAAGLTVTTFLGIYMAFRSNHDRRLIWGLLGAGIAIPLAALLLH